MWMMARIMEYDLRSKAERKRDAKRQCLDHCRERALERYGVEFTDQDITNIRNLVRAGKSMSLGASNGEDCSIHLVPYRNRFYKVVYCRPSETRSWLVTFLPLDHEKVQRPKNIKGKEVRNGQEQHHRGGGA